MQNASLAENINSARRATKDETCAAGCGSWACGRGRFQRGSLWQGLVVGDGLGDLIRSSFVELRDVIKTWSRWKSCWAERQ